MTVGVLPICPRNTGLRAKETDALVYSGWEVFYVLNRTYSILAIGVTSYYKKIRRKLIHFNNIVCPSPHSNSIYSSKNMYIYTTYVRLVYYIGSKSHGI